MFLTTDWNTILIALIAMVGTSFGAWLAYKTAQIVKTATVIHTLVNSAHGTALKNFARSTARHFELTKDPADEAMADEAMKAYLEHQSAQAKADAKE